MTSAYNPQECLERAAMHDRLAAATEDRPARLIHEAMAVEYRRRAAELASTQQSTPRGPILEMYSQQH